LIEVEFELCDSKVMSTLVRTRDKPQLAFFLFVVRAISCWKLLPTSKLTVDDSERAKHFLVIGLVHGEKFVDATTKVTFDNAEAAEPAVVSTEVLAGYSTPVLACHHMLFPHDTVLILVRFLILGEEAAHSTAPPALDNPDWTFFFLVLDELRGGKGLRASPAEHWPFGADLSHVFLDTFCQKRNPTLKWARNDSLGAFLLLVDLKSLSSNPPGLAIEPTRYDTIPAC